MLERRIIEFSRDAIIIADTSRVVRSWNAAAEKLYGIPRERAIGRTTYSLIGMPNAAAVDAALRREGRWDGQLIRRRADGSEIPVESRQWIVREPGEPPVILEIDSEIRARNHNEVEMHAFLDNSPAIAWMKDEDGRIAYLSKSYEREFAVRLEDWRGKTDFELWPPEIAAQFRKNDLEVLAGGKPIEVVEESFRPGGERRYWMNVKFPFSDPSGKRYVGGVGVDVTSQKCLEERIGEAQRLESLGVLAGGIAHTFNNLLTVVLGNASLAKDVCPSSQELDAILAAAERAAELTRQLTAYAGAERSSPRELRLSNLAAEITELLRASVPPNVELQLHLAADPYCVVADPAQIQQILVSLVTNAAEAIEPPRTGVITVKNGVRHLAASQHGLQPGNYVTIAVSDTGRGMSAETVARVFDPFFTTKFAGRGLGLAAVAGIVRTLGGAIAVESAEGQGSTFTVLLPALPPEHACEPPRPAAGTLPQVTMTE